MKKYLSRRKMKTILAAIVLGLCFGMSGYAHAADASAFETPEYFAGRGLNAINASAAYAKGYTGQGVTVGISDEPISFASPEFSTKRNSSYAPGFYPTFEDEDGTVYTVKDPDYWSIFAHATFLAGIVAASRNGLGMHGVAFDAEVRSSVFFEKYTLEDGGDMWSGWPKAFLDDPAIRAVNCSWGSPIYATEWWEENKTMTDYISSVREDEDFREVAEILNSAAAEKDTLFVFASGNDGYEMPGIESTLHWLEGKNASPNVISVTALEDADLIKKDGGALRGKNVVGWFSKLAAFDEASLLAAPARKIVSANATFPVDGQINISESGTSSSAPFVTGATALVQQAYPWMTAKQIGDVLLSTANSNVTSDTGYVVTFQRGKTSCLNIFYFDGKPRTLEQQKEDCLTFLRQEPYLAELASEYVAAYPVCAHYNVPMEELIGQGVLDVGKAVDGPGALNARRLGKSDISGAYTVKGKAAKQALYKVDTQGYDSTWHNDIKEVRVGLLAADSAEEDLQKRYNYYKSNWLDRTHYDSGAPVVGAGFVSSYIDFYNDNVRESGLDSLHVGLLKTGEGRLSLTGNNTYKGASIAAGGTLSIDGSVDGDAYSVDKGTIAGRGTIHGTLYNKNIAVAGDATGSGNLTMDKMVSSGVLLTNYKNGTNTQFIVKGKADINGSTVPLPIGVPTPMPDDKYTVVKAAKIEGTTKDLAGTEYELTGMLSAKNEIEGGNLSVVVEAANNLNGADAVQNETFDAMTAMYRNLKRNNDLRMNQMQPLFYMDGETAKEALSAISSNASAKNMAAVQRSNVTQHLLSARLNEAFMPKPVKVKIPVQHLMDVHESKAASAEKESADKQNIVGLNETKENVTAQASDNADDGIDVTLKLPEPAANDIWLKFGKNWGDVRGATDYHSPATSFGWDKAVGKNWRAGVFAGYGQTSFSDNSSSDKLKDVRFGLYAGFNKAKSEGMVYLDYGWLRNKLRRGVMGMTAGADYHSRILELGGEYLYDLQAGQNKAWHVRPYVNAQLSRLWQNGYSEEGAGVFNQVVQSKHNDYFGMGAGVEFKRYLAGGNYAIRAGVKHAFAGAEPRLRYSYMGDQANTYDMRNVQDKTHFVLSIGGEVEVAKGWSVGGDATWQRGRHDKDLSCSVTVKRTW